VASVSLWPVVVAKKQQIKNNHGVKTGRREAIKIDRENVIISVCFAKIFRVVLIFRSGTGYRSAND